jgi:hypothetical protein
MTGYRPFKISGGVPAKANVAKVANDRSAEDQTLATLATLAVAAAQTTNTGGQPELEPKSDPSELQERKAMAVGGVPDRFLDAWARLQCQRPEGVTEQTWRQAIDDTGRFLDQWGKVADSFGWTPGDLFDVPRDGAMGLVWWLKSRTVTALGPEHASVGQPAYDRVTRREWVNPYSRPVRPVSLSPILEHQQKIMQRVLGR